MLRPPIERLGDHGTAGVPRSHRGLRHGVCDPWRGRHRRPGRLRSGSRTAPERRRIPPCGMPSRGARLTAGARFGEGEPRMGEKREGRARPQRPSPRARLSAGPDLSVVVVLGAGDPSVCAAVGIELCWGGPSISSRALKPAITRARPGAGRMGRKRAGPSGPYYGTIRAPATAHPHATPRDANRYPAPERDHGSPSATLRQRRMQALGCGLRIKPRRRSSPSSSPTPSGEQVPLKRRYRGAGRRPSSST